MFLQLVRKPWRPRSGFC